MTEKTRNDLFYVCSLIEFIARKTLNKRGRVVEAIGTAGIKKQLQDAEVNLVLCQDLAQNKMRSSTS